MSRYIDADKLKAEFDYEHIDMNKTAAVIHHCHILEIINQQPTADVVEVGKWCDMREYIIEMQADENGHNEFFRIIKLNDELKEHIAKEIEKAILYGVRANK